MHDEILIVGCGALATYFASRMSEAGIEVTVLGKWREGLKALEKHGARVEGFDSSPVVIADYPPQNKKYKKVLVLVKSWQTEEAASGLSICLAENGVAVTLQNGLGNDLILSRILGEGRVRRGVTTIGVTLSAPGVVRLGGDGMVILEQEKVIQPLVEILRVANIETKMVGDVTPYVWGKLVVNSAINPISALLGVRNGALRDNPEAMTVMHDLSTESTNVAGELGIILPFIDPKEAVIETIERTSDNISSMLQDIRRGEQTEIESINGTIVRFGKKVRVPTPQNQAVVQLVKALTFEKRR